MTEKTRKQIEAMKQQTIGDEMIVAEDLGILTIAVRELLERTEYPGMKVLQFAFNDPADNDLLPFRFTTTQCICYTGTHDNDTTVGWYLSLPEKLKDRVRLYLNTDGNNIHWDMIRCAMSSIAQYAIYPMQDLLGFGSDCRMNTPSTPSGNWTFRVRGEGCQKPILAAKPSRASSKSLSSKQ